VLALLAIDTALFRTMGGLGMPNTHDLHWFLRQLIDLEQFLLILAHPFDFVSWYFIKEKPFPTTYLYETVRIILIPFSYAFYYLILSYIKLKIK
jgi:hypothetical protein